VPPGCRVTTMSSSAFLRRGLHFRRVFLFLLSFILSSCLGSWCLMVFLHRHFRPLVLFPVQRMFSGEYGTVSAVVVDSVLVFIDAFMRCCFWF
jgi:hypothetical protein